MTSIWIAGIIIAYLILGGIVTVIAEDKGYIIVFSTMGYVFSMILWFPVALILGILLIVKIIYNLKNL